MQFQVPQFLDVEDKIIGPLTIRQFLYIVGGMGMAYMAWRFVPYLGWILAFGFLVLGGMLGFYKFNGKPFVFLIEHVINFYRTERMYIWKRREKKAEADLDISNFKPTKQGVGLLVPGSGGSKLNDLSWSIDVKHDEVEAQKVHSEGGV